jgi:hypothetical protein
MGLVEKNQIGWGEDIVLVWPQTGPQDSPTRVGKMNVVSEDEENFEKAG